MFAANKFFSLLSQTSIFFISIFKKLKTDFLQVSRQLLDIHAFISSVKGEA
jgi:hypothetical protein